jgi:hypothetical protein
MKIVINKCFGGFGLSRAAELELLARECGHVKLEDPATYYGFAKHEDAKERYRDDVEKAEKFDWFWVHFKDGKPVNDDHRYNGRACPKLVALVEEWGERANGRYARLAVVEIPDGVEWEIDNYDGQESVHEKHRSWG